MTGGSGSSFAIFFSLVSSLIKVLNYAFVLYNKSISKIDIVQSIAKDLQR